MAILAGLVGILIIPCVFEITGVDVMPTPITPMSTTLPYGKMSGTNSIFIAAHDSSREAKSQADYVCNGIHDQKEINAAIDALSKGGEVILSEGTFRCDNAIYPQTDITLRGQGDTKTFLKLTTSGVILIDKENVSLDQFHISGNDCDEVVAGLITIRAGHCTVHNVTATSDETVQAMFMVLSTDSSGYNNIIEDIEFTNCKAIDGGGWGFRTSASGTHQLIRNIRYTDCQAINCGRYERIYEWVGGFLIKNEHDIENVRITRCIAEGNWESGFHIEYSGTGTDILFTDCIANNNGQKPYPTTFKQDFMSGFFIGRGDVTLQNCHAEGNGLAGFFIDDGTGVKLYGCTDENTAITRSDFSQYKPASFYIINTYPDSPIVMKNCSSTNSNGRALYVGPKEYSTKARVENFVMTNAAGVDGTAIQLNHIRSGSEFDIHASGNRASTLIRVYNSLDSDYTGSIVSDVAKPIVFDGSDTKNTLVHDIEILSNTLPVGSTGITMTGNVPKGAVQIINCHVTSPNSFFGFLSEGW
ncbi:right-handed parallel beta-helix repeat-containing protein [Methanogenium organophilum]|uniref:Right-handed parallel beta-helix repeat-containing protein n=1 Tax=Methanogenium organophilum TaxID=2199 RepID=A0A9X9T7Y5_METOG|nr:right-handed parallel beta-helix repeat-containing protein [Methanogenium organophilum]WAI01180.1 right-handed parallel beta-helix repeat-containing protein [Methanogenium organophilum]